MIDYINKYYPNGTIYGFVNSDVIHIDSRWLENEYMYKISDINWCMPNKYNIATIINIPYCKIVYYWEKILWNTNDISH